MSEPQPLNPPDAATTLHPAAEPLHPQLGPAPTQPGLPFSMPAAPLASQPVPSPPEPRRIPHWLHQSERFLRVIVRMYLGLLVCLAPWFPAAWDNNPLFAGSPSLMAFIAQGWVRGLVSGLGLLNLYIALRNAIHDPEPDR